VAKRNGIGRTRRKRYVKKRSWDVNVYVDWLLKFFFTKYVYFFFFFTNIIFRSVPMKLYYPKNVERTMIKVMPGGRKNKINNSYCFSSFFSVSKISMHSNGEEEISHSRDKHHHVRVSYSYNSN
jgi:hypothetical protein